MKASKNLKLALLVASLVAGPALLAMGTWAADAPMAPAKVGLGAESVLWLEGTSNVHDFESRTQTLKLTLTRDGATVDPANAAALDQMIRANGVRGLDLDIPLATMHSGKAGLDKNMLKALKADQNPSIKFHLAHYTLGTAVADTTPVTAEGTLSVAGKERPVSVKGRLIRTAQGEWLEGSHSLLMTEYDVKPPTMMLGALRVNDRILVRYRLLLTSGNGASGSAVSAN
jgi:hypothetical protein